MKLTIIGGGSVRTPHLIPTLVRRADALQLDELCLMDIEAHKLKLIGSLAQSIASTHNAPFRVTMTTDAVDALKDADHVVTSIRPGFEQGRAIDERICFDHGLLGQETTGAAGFAMAMRSAPAILHYARLAEKHAKPGAWLFNFTNPAGLVAQVLHDAGVERVIGICDSANKAQHAVGRYLNIERHRLQHRVYGLNHLSWTRHVYVDPDENGENGEEVLSGLLGDDDFVQQTHLKMFAPGLLNWQGAFLNEYLHYYYHRDEALVALLSKEETRGEEVLRLTIAMLQALEAADTVEARLEAYERIMNERSATYMAHARAGKTRDKAEYEEDDTEGYAGVALGCIEAIVNDDPIYIGLNVPNKGAIIGMADDDIVEVACWVTGDGVNPVHIGRIPDHQRQLMEAVKLYERLASTAILNRARATAIQALTMHPLVGTYPLAEKLIAAFIAAHQDWIGEWQ